MAAFRARKRKILEKEEIESLLEDLTNKFGGHWGYAGSYARGRQKLSSDLDIVYKDVVLDYSNYFDTVQFIESKIPIRFDLIDIELCKKDDEEMDMQSIKIGLPINDTSIYKNIERDVIWHGR